MFLYAAEELNFTRAAERAFVTQQCLSDHIRRLEKSCGAKLFDRTPRLCLTRAGEILYASLLEIRRIENTAAEAITDSSPQVHGQITFGMHIERTHLIFPTLFSAFHREYPNVRISLVSEHTLRMKEKLAAGELDMMLGLDIIPEEGYIREPVMTEPVYLFATERFLRRWLPERPSGQPWLEPGDISHLPLSTQFYGGSLAKYMDQFFMEQNVIPHYICEVGDYLTQLMLCRSHDTAFFCPESFLLEEEFMAGREGPAEERVHALPIRGMDSRLHIDIYYSARRHLPEYVHVFRRMLKELYQKKVSNVRDQYVKQL